MKNKKLKKIVKENLNNDLILKVSKDKANLLIDSITKSVKVNKAQLKKDRKKSMTKFV
jgi:hypothetical protein